MPTPRDRPEPRGARGLLSRGGLRAGLIVLAGAAAFAVTLQVSVAGAFRSNRPQVALMMAPFDAVARSRLAGQLAASGPGEARAAARRLALDAIRRDPLQPVAVRVLGQVGDPQDPASQQRSATIMREALRLSKRDLPTHMWLVEHYGRQGDLAAMVHHFDLALRFSESARPGIYPLLTASAADPRVEELILRTLAEKPNWAAQFARYSAEGGGDLDFAVKVVPLLLDPGDEQQRPYFTALLQRLVGFGRYAAAWRLYTDPELDLRSGEAASVRNGGFEAREDNSPFDWAYAQEPELWASRERVDDNFVLRVAAYNGRSGDAAWQVLRLPAGPHRLQARVGEVPSASFERPMLRVECMGSGVNAALVTATPGQAGAGSRRLEARFVVPPDCAFQRLTIAVAGEGTLRDPTPWVDDVRIE